MPAVRAPATRPGAGCSPRSPSPPATARTATGTRTVRPCTDPSPGCRSSSASLRTPPAPAPGCRAAPASWASPASSPAGRRGHSAGSSRRAPPHRHSSSHCVPASQCARIRTGAPAEADASRPPGTARPRRRPTPRPGTQPRAHGQRGAQAPKLASVIEVQNHRLKQAQQAGSTFDLVSRSARASGGSPLPRRPSHPAPSFHRPHREGEPLLAIRLHDRRPRDHRRARGRIAPGRRHRLLQRAAGRATRPAGAGGHARARARDRGAARALSRRARRCGSSPRRTPPRSAPSAPGSQRSQRMLAWAGPIDGEQLALDTAILHLAPVARESPTAGAGAPASSVSPRRGSRAAGALSASGSSRRSPTTTPPPPRSRSRADAMQSSSTSTSAPAAPS